MKRTAIGDALWGLLLLIITTIFVLPLTHRIFISWTNSHPYWMGFIKFALLASMGELLALRLAHRSWKRPVGMGYKIIVWGLIGMLITFMFRFYSTGISAMVDQGTIATGNSLLSTLYTALLTSVIMNLTFGIVFMAIHRMSDTYIEMRFRQKNPSMKELIQAIKWEGFITFVVFKTIPLFWIPAHTITFFIPAYYRVILAAYLSIILGVILVYAKRVNNETKINEDDNG